MRYMFWVGRIGEEFSNHKIAAITAKMTLDELEKTNPGVLTRHLERFWNELVDEFDDSWDDSAIESEIPRIWQKATINKPRHATSRPVSEILRSSIHDPRSPSLVIGGISCWRMRSTLTRSKT
jgi:hypothetical protein